jgi:hypothetical protein
MAFEPNVQAASRLGRRVYPADPPFSEAELQLVAATRILASWPSVDRASR